MKRIVEESSQNVNSNAGIFLAKQILDAIPSFAKFDSCQPSEKSLACQTYSNSGIAKAEVALMTLGKTSFCDIAAHQKDDLFADAAVCERLDLQRRGEKQDDARDDGLADVPAGG